MPTTRRSRSELDLSKVDRSRVDATTDEEIARQAAEGEDTAPLSSAEEILAADVVTRALAGREPQDGS